MIGWIIISATSKIELKSTVTATPKTKQVITTAQVSNTQEVFATTFLQYVKSYTKRYYETPIDRVKDRFFKHFFKTNIDLLTSEKLEDKQKFQVRFNFFFNRKDLPESAKIFINFVNTQDKDSLKDDYEKLNVRKQTRKLYEKRFNQLKKLDATEYTSVWRFVFANEYLETYKTHNKHESISSLEEFLKTDLTQELIEQFINKYNLVSLYQERFQQKFVGENKIEEISQKIIDLLDRTRLIGMIKHELAKLLKAKNKHKKQKQTKEQRKKHRKPKKYFIRTENGSEIEASLVTEYQSSEDDFFSQNENPYALKIYSVGNSSDEERKKPAKDKTKPKKDRRKLTTDTQETKGTEQTKGTQQTKVLRKRILFQEDPSGELHEIQLNEIHSANKKNTEKPVIIVISDDETVKKNNFKTNKPYQIDSDSEDQHDLQKNKKTRNAGTNCSTKEPSPQKKIKYNY